MFQCVRIPADASALIETVSLSKAGGLTNDELAAHCKQYFAKLLKDPSDPFSAASCLDIMAVTVPMAGNSHMAVSLYRFGGESSATLPANERATALVRACGHAIPSPVQGDVFVGRAHDDEMADIWERVDFTVDDADPKASWCQTARQTGGGGGSGRASAASLSGIMQQSQMGNNNNLQLLSGEDSSEALPSATFGMDGTAAVQDNGYLWTQDREELELKFAVPSATVSKDCKIHFGRNSLKVTVAGNTVLEGATFLPIVADECTYTLTREAGSDTKDLTVTLMKEKTSTTWTFVVQ